MQWNENFSGVSRLHNKKNPIEISLFSNSINSKKILYGFAFFVPRKELSSRNFEGFLLCKFSKNHLKEFFPRFTSNHHLQQSPHRIFSKNHLQKSSSRISSKNFLQELPPRITSKNHLKKSSSRITSKNYLQKSSSSKTFVNLNESKVNW